MALRNCLHFHSLSRPCRYSAAANPRKKADTSSVSSSAPRSAQNNSICDHAHRYCHNVDGACPSALTTASARVTNSLTGTPIPLTSNKNHQR